MGAWENCIALHVDAVAFSKYVEMALHVSCRNVSDGAHRQPLARYGPFARPRLGRQTRKQRDAGVADRQLFVDEIANRALVEIRRRRVRIRTPLRQLDASVARELQ